MGTPAADDPLSTDDLRRMVRVVEADWTLDDASPVDAGRSPVYAVTASTPGGDRECFLKTAPSPDRPSGIGTEARLTETVRVGTRIPTPTVLGAVDDHERLPSPYFLMTAMPGEFTTREDRPVLPLEDLRAVARQSGQFLGQLHEIPLPNVDGFGAGLSHRGPPLRGERPSGDPGEFVLPGGTADWTGWLRDWMDDALADLAAGDRFDDLVDPLSEESTERLDALSGPFTPAIGRFDHGTWNLLFGPEGRITGVVDWGALFVLPPSFDLAFVEYHLAGGRCIGLDGVPDHRATVGEALRDGYADVRPVPDDHDRRLRAYRLCALILGLHALDSGDPGAIPRNRHDEAASGFRELVRSELDRPA